MLLTSITLFVFWGLPWTINKLIPHNIEKDSHDMQRDTKLVIE